MYCVFMCLSVWEIGYSVCFLLSKAVPWRSFLHRWLSFITNLTLPIVLLILLQRHNCLMITIFKQNWICLSIFHIHAMRKTYKNQWPLQSCFIRLENTLGFLRQSPFPIKIRPTPISRVRDLHDDLEWGCVSSEDEKRVCSRKTR